MFWFIDITAILLPLSGSNEVSSYKLDEISYKDDPYKVGLLAIAELPVIVGKFLIVPDTKVDCS